LAFHPPTLYAGYVGLSVAFSFAVGALVTGQVGAGFSRANGLEANSRKA
jgi:cytochrome c-type biogenesis protein CcmF